MLTRLIFLLQDSPKASTLWSPIASFEDEAEAIKAKLIQEERNPDFRFKVTQVPHKLKE